ncbi:MAG: hypothetical protein JWQ11_3846, partial [Rhizobacter sp.]|nr:hypothetical protein [Rhizobacter sp.]
MTTVEPIKRGRVRKRLAAILLLLVLCAAGLAASGFWWLNRPMPFAGDSAELAIELGTPPREIAQGWVSAGVQVSPTLLYEWFRWSGQARKIRAGSYEIERGTTPMGLLNKLVRGDETMAVVRLIEGWTFRQFRAELAKADSLKSTIGALTDAQVMDLLGDASPSPEGRF